MQATRVRFVSLLEWAAAAIVVAALATLGTIVARQFRMVNAVTPVIAGDSRPDSPVPAGVPSRAVSVPVLLLSGGLVARVGDRLDAVAPRLAGASEIRPPSVERAPTGERLTRFYEFAGARFVLVFEPFELDTEPRIAAIYIQ
jgi:hypothetical protein